MSVASRLMDRFLKHMDQPSLDPTLKMKAKEEVQDIRESARIVSDPEGYEKFIIDYVQEQHQEFRDGERSAKLCTCDISACKLKDGQVPRTVKEADDINDGIREFEQDHTGRPVVLKDAKSEYEEMTDEVEETLQEVNISLQNEIPLEELRDE